MFYKIWKIRFKYILVKSYIIKLLKCISSIVCGKVITKTISKWEDEMDSKETVYG